jgi:hypothetical protein
MMEEPMRVHWSVTSILVAALAAAPQPAQACGCFATTTTVDPVVQAGERILFAHDGNDVVAYIQIQYQGSAGEFGWLLPLPSVPTLGLATDELFDQLTKQTQPLYQRQSVNRCNGTRSSNGPAFGCAASDASNIGGTADPTMMDNRDMNEVVVQSSIGPYDYAVLKADDKTEMLDWLNANHYFIPAATDDAVTPYIHPGAYFLALKLKAGEATGAIQPVVVRYPSDLPMIPIILTQVGAVPHMAIQVWELGQARAIPRNYYHVVTDDIALWLDPQETYQTMVTDAIAEAPAKHGFVTEYAGSSEIMQGVLAPPGRFGLLTYLRGIPHVLDYLGYLKTNGYLFDSNLLSILAAHIAEPQVLIDHGISREAFFSNAPASFAYLDQLDPNGRAMLDAAFDPGATTDEIDMRVVQPTLDENQLFYKHIYLTRLLTVLSPEDMTADPVFSENPDLPDVPLLHGATLTTGCQGAGVLKTDQGVETNFPRSTVTDLPAALRVETLRDSGPPIVAIDNGGPIAHALGPVDESALDSPSGPNPSGSGCACSVRSRKADIGSLALISLALIALQVQARRKRR